MMAAIKNKKSLTLDPIPKVHKKYLGEPDDLHFIPSSPLIDRAIFTEQEEGELKRLCALALAHVPHSDDPEPVPPQPEATVPRKYKVANKEDVKLPPPQFSDTRTPSEASKRDTVGTATDYSTPLTSAGITPGEPVKRFSDNSKRGSGSKAPATSSNLRFDSWQQAYQRAKSNSHPPPKPLQPVDPRKTIALRKSTASAPVGAERTILSAKETSRGSCATGLDHSQSADLPRANRYSHAELNKKLPPLPKDAAEDNGPKTAPLSRMFKTIVRKKSSLHDDDCEPLTGATTRPNTALNHTKSAPPTPAIGTDGKKFASKLRIFGRKERTEGPSKVIAVP